MKNLLVCLFIAFIFEGYAQKNDSLIADLSAKAGEANGQGSYLTALRFYDELIALDPNNGKWFFYRGQDYSMLNNYKKAEADYAQAIALTPQYFDAYVARAVTYFGLGEIENAINDYNNALRYASDDAMRVFILNNRGNAKSVRGDFDGAYSDFFKAFQLDTNAVITLENLGRSLNALDRSEEAAFFIEKSLAINPSNFAAQQDLAYTYLSLRKFEASVNQYNVVLTSVPNSTLALANRALAHFNMGNNTAAFTDINRSIELNADNAYSYRNRGMINISLGRISDGCTDYQKALDLGFSEKFDSEVQEFYNYYCKKPAK